METTDKPRLDPKLWARIRDSAYNELKTRLNGQEGKSAPVDELEVRVVSRFKRIEKKLDWAFRLQMLVVMMTGLSWGMLGWLLAREFLTQ